jgi:inner membrane protein involved in colicin E2 resistance
LYDIQALKDKQGMTLPQENTISANNYTMDWRAKNLYNNNEVDYVDDNTKKP